MTRITPVAAFATLIITLAACTTPTRQHMRVADTQLIQSQQKQVAGDWSGALALAQQASDEVKLGVDAKPVRSGAGGQDVELTPLLAAWVNGPHRELMSALSGKHTGRASAAFASTRQQCANCHTVIGKPDTKITPWPQP